MSHYVPAPTIEEDFVNLVRLELDDIKHSFFKIGFRLREANNCKYYLKLGFESIEDCAEALFGFGKTTTYDLMRISFLFANKDCPMQIDPTYEGYSQSQLVLFSQINLSQRNFIKMASPSDSITKLKKAKKYWTMVQRGKVQSFLGWGTCKSFDEFIEKVETYNPQLLPGECVAEDPEPDQITIDDFSGYPENNESADSEATVEPTVVPDEEEAAEPDEAADEETSAEPTATSEKETVSEWDKSISDHLIPACAKMISYMSYKTIFDPDDKGLGVRVMPDDLARQMIETAFKAFQDNHTVIKTKFRNYIAERLGQFDYEISLCGKKQGLTPFCGNIASFIMDLFFEEWNALTPDEKPKKKRK